MLPRIRRSDNGYREYPAEVETLERRTGELKAERRALLALIEQWNDRLAKACEGERVHLLEKTRA